MQIVDFTEHNLSELLEFLKIKADFDRSMGAAVGDITTNESRIRKTLFSERPYAFAKLIKLHEQSVGFALYYFHYSSFKGQPSIWLEDLLIREGYRSQKFGHELMVFLRKVAKSNDCSHIGWTASSKNERAIVFYERLGAQKVGTIRSSIFFELEV